MQRGRMNAGKWPGSGFPGGRRKLTLPGRAIEPKVSLLAPPRTHTGGQVQTSEEVGFQDTCEAVSPQPAAALDAHLTGVFNLECRPPLKRPTAVALPAPFSKSASQ